MRLQIFLEMWNTHHRHLKTWLQGRIVAQTRIGTSTKTNHNHLRHPNWFLLLNVVAARRDVAAAPQTPQLGGGQANFGGPS